MPSPGMHILLSLKQHIRLYHKPHISGFCTYRFTDNGSRFTFFALSMDDGRSLQQQALDETPVMDDGRYLNLSVHG
jgi:hypothetical protein